jgi:hypothetical protein
MRKNNILKVLCLVWAFLFLIAGCATKKDKESEVWKDDVTCIFIAPTTMSGPDPDIRESYYPQITQAVHDDLAKTLKRVLPKEIDLIVSEKDNEGNCPTVLKSDISNLNLFTSSEDSEALAATLLLSIVGGSVTPVGNIEIRLQLVSENSDIVLWDNVFHGSFASSGMSMRSKSEQVKYIMSSANPRIRSRFPIKDPNRKMQP